MMTLRVRLTSGIGVLLVWMAAAAAAPEDDYKRALESYNRGDVVAAMTLLRSPAKAGHAPSQTMLAFILEQADFTEEAFGLYREAAAQNSPDGHAGLANAYLAGRGVAKDEKLAAQHFSKAAALGHGKSIDIMAEAYLGGRMGLGGAPADEVVASVRAAAAQGHLPSVEALAEAYRVGRWGIAANAEQADQWAKRAAELKAQRAGPPPPKKKGSK